MHFVGDTGIQPIMKTLFVNDPGRVTSDVILKCLNPFVSLGGFLFKLARK